MGQKVLEMEIKTLQDILNTINSQIPYKPEFILCASKMVVDLIEKNNYLMIDCQNNYRIFTSLFYNIKIFVEPFFIGYQMYLFKDGKLLLLVDEEGNGNIIEK